MRFTSCLELLVINLRDSQFLTRTLPQSTTKLKKLTWIQGAKSEFFWLRCLATHYKMKWIHLKLFLILSTVPFYGKHLLFGQKINIEKSCCCGKHSLVANCAKSVPCGGNWNVVNADPMSFHRWNPHTVFNCWCGWKQLQQVACRIGAEWNAWCCNGHWSQRVHVFFSECSVATTEEPVTQEDVTDTEVTTVPVSQPNRPPPPPDRGSPRVPQRPPADDPLGTNGTAAGGKEKGGGGKPGLKGTECAHSHQRESTVWLGPLRHCKNRCKILCSIPTEEGPKTQKKNHWKCDVACTSRSWDMQE